MTPGEVLLKNALKKVESASIRAWVVCPENAATWAKIAESAAAKSGVGEHGALKLATYITTTAIGA